MEIDYHAFLKCAVITIPTDRILKIYIYKNVRRKKELNGIRGLLTDFCFFPGQFFTTIMPFGLWVAVNFEKLTFSENLEEEDHCSTKQHYTNK